MRSVKYGKDDCIVPRCISNHICRGLCRKHYNMARRLVQENQTTWNQLEDADKCLPSNGVGRPASKDAKWFLETPF